MKAFFKEFLRDQPVGAGAGRQIFLAAFGKHPGWNDHMDDIGLETESLVAAKTRLYVDGIGGQIGSGAWEKLDGFQQIPFHHTFVWSRPPQFLIGKLWASRDGKGRDRYPMIICAHTIGISLELALQGVLPSLEVIHETCTATKSAEDVMAVVSHYREELPRWFRDAAELPSNVDVPSFLGGVGVSGDDAELCKALAEVRASQQRARAGKCAEHFRFPAAISLQQLSIQFWEHFLTSQIDAEAPKFIASPSGQYWLDSIIGEPCPADFFCLRTSPRVTPMTNESTVEVTPKITADMRSLLDSLATGAAPGVERKSWVSRFFR